MKIKNAFALICYALTLFICFILPIILAVYISRRAKAPTYAVVAGIAIFLIFQVFTRIPLLGYIQGTSWYFHYVSFNVWASIAFWAGSAGVFEECGRFLAFRYWLKRDLSWSCGIAYGIGHGGIEAMYIGVAFVSAVKDIYSLAPLTLLLPGAERLLAMVIQIALSLVVLYGVRNRKYIFLLWAILLHAAIDAPIFLVHNVFILEGFVLVAALIAGFYIYRSRHFLGFQPVS
ncbi:MAG: YhfC family glutamic-type intramembrane protease [Firmicutes bacterium]|nr:YhfC family glutamic-type intramembrane protease [Bacillota bacterium]